MNNSTQNYQLRTRSHLAASILAHSLGVKLDDQSMPFNGFHYAVDLERDNRELKTRNLCLVLSLAYIWGLFFLVGGK